MNEYGKLYERDGRCVLQFERVFAHEPKSVFRRITDPDYFTKWYPFATGEMELKEGGRIDFDDGEGTKYEGVITAFEPPVVFAFREVDDLLRMELQNTPDGCRMTFEHKFDDRSWVAATAAGWHRCLDALSKMVNDQPPEWPDNRAELREFYRNNFSD
ncbi:SRPBCC family protein [Virgibacillus sp. L01]|uniref:SRPBCC family protein n=1 Tax=Virgibacillus sp. L01 TaxID=3457429 RepID=UPI003FCFF427